MGGGEGFFMPPGLTGVSKSILYVVYREENEPEPFLGSLCVAILIVKDVTTSHYFYNA
jgi:hypothetical protein